MIKFKIDGRESTDDSLKCDIISLLPQGGGEVVFSFFMTKQQFTDFAAEGKEWFEENQKPIRTNKFDWTAVEMDYEPGRPVGYGSTEQEAINELIEQLEEKSHD